MREEGVAIIGMRVGRILDKTHWTKALGVSQQQLSMGIVTGTVS
jgi:hypothetical protein